MSRLDRNFFYLFEIMQTESVKYLHLSPDAVLPELEGMRHFKAILVIEADALQTWQWDVSRWLVSSGCRYMLAWGMECEAWHDSVDEANLERFDYEDMPDEELVMTTWHDDEDLEEVFWFAKNCAGHPVLILKQTLIIHISKIEKQSELQEQYGNA